MSEIPLVAEDQRPLRELGAVLFRAALVAIGMRPILVTVGVKHQLVAKPTNLGSRDRPVNHFEGVTERCRRTFHRRGAIGIAPINGPIKPAAFSPI